jgi:hypothetical protein
MTMSVIINLDPGLTSHNVECSNCFGSNGGRNAHYRDEDYGNDDGLHADHTSLLMVIVLLVSLVAVI